MIVIKSIELVGLIAILFFSNLFSIYDNVEVKKSSLDINIPNIDLDQVHDTNPLGEEEIEELVSFGIDYEKAIQMDYGDYKIIKGQQKLNEDVKQIALRLYPELTSETVENWTYNDFDAYIEKKNDEIYAPTEEEAEALINKGLTLDDARYLLKVFHSYETILEQPNEVLKDYIVDYYTFKIDYLHSLKKVEAYNKNRSRFDNRWIFYIFDLFK